MSYIQLKLTGREQLALCFAIGTIERLAEDGTFNRGRRKWPGAKTLRQLRQVKRKLLTVR